MVFYIVIGIYMVSMIIFDIFGSGEAQPWSVKLDAEEKTEQPKK